ncbi:PWWP domain-containing protein MUM1L1 isoform X1 [Lingula anatina]|uniref:PWWP domain-containing protein MUM1L1 isoform X1 n=1 Tax=Lingula anatina TaxID=7574 RepID=A0A1S3HDP8_LINAN|nr:PWWP domain-containing protein MUM1L1 isoform X1 [Lingula anatina]|eukprot:XP_013384163.1 PWWP domain-containing protein MUM1L1 isoform X1 [Lingula anatina]
MYQEQDIVWVKIPRYPWWPAVVVNEDDCPLENTGKQVPIAYVKFLGEDDQFEIVKNEKNLKDFNCAEKEGLITKGKALDKAGGDHGIEMRLKFDKALNQVDRLLGKQPSHPDLIVLPEVKNNVEEEEDEEEEEEAAADGPDGKGRSRSVRVSKLNKQKAAQHQRSQSLAAAKEKLVGKKPKKRTPKKPKPLAESIEFEYDKTRANPKKSTFSVHSPDIKGSPSSDYTCHNCDFTVKSQNLIIQHMKYCTTPKNKGAGGASFSVKPSPSLANRTKNNTQKQTPLASRGRRVAGKVSNLDSYIEKIKAAKLQKKKDSKMSQAGTTSDQATNGDAESSQDSTNMASTNMSSVPESVAIKKKLKYNWNNVAGESDTPESQTALDNDDEPSTVDSQEMETDSSPAQGKKRKTSESSDLSIGERPAKSSRESPTRELTPVKEENDEQEKRDQEVAKEVEQVLEMDPSKAMDDLDRAISLANAISSEMQAQESKKSSFDPNVDASDSDNDEELPSVLSSKLEETCPFEVNDVVWVKVRNYPFWPCVIKRLYPNDQKKKKRVKKVSVFFIGDKKSFGVCYNPNRIKPFHGPRHEEYKMQGLQSDQKERFEEALTAAEDFIRKRGLGLIEPGIGYRYFCDPDYDSPVQEDELRDSSPEKDMVPERTESVAKSTDEESVETEEEETPVSQQEKQAMDSELKRNEKNLKLIEFIKSDTMKEYLTKIYHGEKQCDRHEQHKKCDSQRQKMKRQGTGPITDEDQLEEIHHCLSSLYRSVSGSDKLDDYSLSYVMDVWLVEAIIYALIKVKGYNRGRAEEMFKKGAWIYKAEKVLEHKMMLETTHKEEDEEEEGNTD